MARPMKQEDEAEVIDLRRYRAAQAAAKAKEKARQKSAGKAAGHGRAEAQARPGGAVPRVPQAAPPRTPAPGGGGEPLLGARPRSGLILAIVVLLAFLAFILPVFLHGPAASALLR